MQVKDILTQERVECGNEDIRSKKAVLEHLAEILANDCAAITAHNAFNGLFAREKLGSTGLGHGISIPHGRMPGLKETRGAFLKLPNGVDYDAIDNQPVDMFFALIVPEESTDEHLMILAQLAEKFSDKGFLETLREQSEPEKVFKMLTEDSS